MASNKVSFELTLNNILARMNPGRKYTAYHLADKFKVPTDVVRPKVLELLKIGAVKLVPAERKNYYMKVVVGGTVEISEEAEPAVIANGDFAVAAPLIPVDLTSNLKGYDASFTRMRDLCMTLRRVA